jgi:hypothetical protein
MNKNIGTPSVGISTIINHCNDPIDADAKIVINKDKKYKDSVDSISLAIEKLGKDSKKKTIPTMTTGRNHPISLMTPDSIADKEGSATKNIPENIDTTTVAVTAQK